METLGTDFNATGSVMSKSQLEEHRRRRGECLTCGRKCFQKKLFKLIPITDDGFVLEGRCLKCRPIAQPHFGGMSPSPSIRGTVRTSSEDRERFNRTQNNLSTRGVVPSSHSFGPSSSPSGRSRMARTISDLSKSDNSGSGGSKISPRQQFRRVASAMPQTSTNPPARMASLPLPLTTTDEVSDFFIPPPQAYTPPPPQESAYQVQAAVVDNSVPAERHPIDNQLYSPSESNDTGMAKTRGGKSKTLFKSLSTKITGASRKNSDGDMLLSPKRRSLSAQLPTKEELELAHQTILAAQQHGIYSSSEFLVASSPDQQGRSDSSTNLNIQQGSSSSSSDVVEPTVIPEETPNEIDGYPVPQHGVLNRGGMVPVVPANNASAKLYTSNRSNRSSKSLHSLEDSYQRSNSARQVSTVAQSPDTDLMAGLVISDNTQVQMPKPTEEESWKNLDRAGQNIDLILQIMRDNMTSIRIATTGLERLAACKLSPDEQDHFGSIGAHMVISDVMQSHQDTLSIQLAALGALWNMSATTQNQEAMANSRVLDMILTAKDRFVESAELQETAIAILSNLGAARENLDILCEKGVLVKIVDTMTKFSEVSSIQVKGCGAVSNLAAHDGPVKQRLMECGAGGAVVVAMVMHPNDTYLIEKTLRALRNLCANSDDNKVEVANIGGIDSVITAMQVHRDVLAIQREGARTLSNLATNQNNRDVIGECGGVDVVIRAMWVHSDNAELQEWCCRALHTLTLSDENCQIVLEVGGISAIVSTMQGHVDSATVQEMGCAVLGNLAGNDHSKTRIVQEEALDAIVLAMVLHTSESQVQERACTVLMRLAVPANHYHMIAANIPELVRTAASNFPDRCNEPANHVLRILSEAY